MRSFSLENRTALVTGGASGIGFGIVVALVQRGANVVVADVRIDHLNDARVALGAYGDRVLIQRMDVTREDDWEQTRQAVVTRFGTLHVLCLNAGIGILGKILQARPHDWNWVVGVNLRGVTLGLETFLPVLRGNSDGGRISATSSIGGLIVAGDDGLYACAKFGVTALMECLRAELAGEGIGVTTLFPAAVNTNIHDHASMRPRDFADSGFASTPEQQRAMTEMARAVLARGADPLNVGERLVAAMIADEPYVFTDALVAPVVQVRRDALLSATVRS
jgi:NAD(P)-dependent dehydrogenase (short-subunit alcohol dehydrogenase family)